MTGVSLGSDESGRLTRLLVDVPALLQECGLRLRPSLFAQSPAAVMARSLGWDEWVSPEERDALHRIESALLYAADEWWEVGGYKVPATDQGLAEVRARLHAFIAERFARQDVPFDVLEVM